MDDNERAARILGWHEKNTVYYDDEGRPHGFTKDFGPLHLWRDAGRLMEKMGEKPRRIRHKFDTLLRNAYVKAEGTKVYYESFICWLTPEYITRAAVEACEKEKG